MRIPFTKYEIRTKPAVKPSPWDDYWYQASYESKTGIDVTEDLSLTYSAVWSCVKVISEDLASLPLHVYRRDGRSKERAEDHPLYWLLHNAPNPEMSAMQFRETLQAHLLTWGNGYAEIQRNLRGQPMALWPLNPANMEVKRPANELVYEYRLADGTKKLFSRADILHVAGLGYNGLIGYSPISYQREAVGCGLQGQDWQSTNFKNCGRLQLAFVHPNPRGPSEEGRKHFREAIRKEYGGPSGQQIAVLWEGMDVKTLSMTPEDAQFIEGRKYNRVEIAGIFRVPPHKIMDLERATFSNIEQQNISYVIDTLRPWCVRWEQAINQQLLQESGKFFAEHNVDGLLRGDIASRYAAYAVGRQWGWLTVNQIRGLENMNPVAGGDTRLEPLNMVSIDESGNRVVDEPPAPAAPEAPITDEEKEEAARMIQKLKLLANHDPEAEAARLKLVPTGTHPGQQHREESK